MTDVESPPPEPEGAASPDNGPGADASREGADAPEDRGRTILRIAAPFYGIVAVFAVGYALFSQRIGTLFGERAPTLAHLAAGLGVGLALVALTRVLSRSWAPMTRLADGLSDMLGPIAWTWALPLALLSGVAEELLFRGALWPTLELLGTTFLFALLHVLPRRSLWLYPVFALVAGLLMGLLREGTQSLWPPVIAHVTVNALNLVWIGGRARKRGPPSTAEEAPEP